MRVPTETSAPFQGAFHEDGDAQKGALVFAGALSRLHAAAAAVLLLAAGPALAAQPIPLRAGTYCGPGDARIVVDVAQDLVEVDGYVCSFPIIAADKMQSEYCTKPGTATGKQIFDFRVVGRFFSHDHAWYRACGPVPADFRRPEPTDPNAAPAPVKTGG